MMRKLLAIAVFVGLCYGFLGESGRVDRFRDEATTSDSVIVDAYENGKSDLLVEGSGEVVRVLADDVDGDRHQRFVLRLKSGHTLLIAHNIDFAPRLSHLKEGDLVEFFGEYEWNDRGGVIHWTHRDPQSQHEPRWLRHEGKTYQ